jgi:hypothetical protein
MNEKPEKKQVEPACDVSQASRAADLGHERRTERRIVHKAVIIMAIGPGVNSEFEQADMVDCSTHGIGIVLPHALVLGSRFFVKVKLSTVALASYTVRYCQRMPEGYRIGAEYCDLVGTPSDCAAGPQLVCDALLKH